MTAREAVSNAAAARPFQWGSIEAAQLFASRSWSDGAAYHFHRPAAEMAWVGQQHRLSLQLRAPGRAQLQVEGSPSREFTALAPLSFTPAGVAIRTVMGEGTVVALMQSQQIYDEVATEMTHVGRIDFEPLWSIDDPVLEGFARLVLQEIAGAFGDELLLSVLSRAVAVAVTRSFAGTDTKLAEAGKLAAGRITRVLDYIDAHLGDRLSLDEIADIACLSPFHFARCFKHTTGRGLHQFVIRRRIGRAKELIARSAMSLAEIAVTVGFDSQAALTSRFAREVGVSPGAYRRELLGQRSNRESPDDQN